MSSSKGKVGPGPDSNLHDLEVELGLVDPAPPEVTDVSDEEDDELPVPEEVVDDLVRRFSHATSEPYGGDDEVEANDGEAETRRMSVMMGLSSMKAYTRAKKKKTGESHCDEQLARYFRASPQNQMTQKVFRSGAAITSERTRQLSGESKFIIHPFSSFRWYWDMIMVVVLMTDIIILPINISFFSEVQAEGLEADYNHSLNIIMLAFDFVFLIDIILNFRTGYLNEWTEKVILDKTEIAKHYAKTWFSLDILSSVPFDQLYMLFTGGTGLENEDTFLAFRILKLTKLLCLLRVLRMLRLLRYINRLEEAVAEALNIDGSVIRVFNLIFLIMMVSHWNGCIQYLSVFIAEFPEKSWVMIDGLKNATAGEKYTSSLFRAMSHMLSIGYGSEPPGHVVDQWTIMISMMVGATFYALFIGHMSSLLVNMDAPGRVYNEKVTQVKEYMKYRRLPMRLQQRVFDYYEHKYQRKYFDEEDILNMSMSHVLRKEIMSHNCQNLVKKVSFLSNGPPEFILDIIAHLKFEVFMPGDYIIEAGKRGSCMYFVEYGKVEVILPSGQVVNRLVDGSHFGEIALLMAERRVASVKAVEVCDCYRLTRNHFNTVLLDFPYMRKHMEKIVQDRLMSIKRHSRDPGTLSSAAEVTDRLNKMQSRDASSGVAMEDPRPNSSSLCRIIEDKMDKMDYQTERASDADYGEALAPNTDSVENAQLSSESPQRLGTWSVQDARREDD